MKSHQVVTTSRSNTDLPHDCCDNVSGTEECFWYQRMSGKLWKAVRSAASNSERHTKAVVATRVTPRAPPGLLPSPPARSHFDLSMARCSATGMCPHDRLSIPTHPPTRVRSVPLRQECSVTNRARAKTRRLQLDREHAETSTEHATEISQSTHCGMRPCLHHSDRFSSPSLLLPVDRKRRISLEFGPSLATHTCRW